MKWIKVSKYAIASGEYRICKITVSGVDQYEVYRGSEFVGQAASGQAARKIAERDKEMA